MNLRDILDYLMPILGVLTALFTLITTAIKLIEIIIGKKPENSNFPQKERQIKQKKLSAWLKRLLIITIILFICLALVVLIKFLTPPPNRHIVITLPNDTVHLKQEFINNSQDFSYTFTVYGECKDCKDDEWVQVLVRPPQLGPYVPSEAVPVIDDKWESLIHIGDSQNLIEDGQTLIIQAVVIQEDDTIPVEKRLSHPQKAKERGLSKQLRLKASFQNKE